MPKKDISLVFVYNADGNLFASLADTIHKIVSPGSYECNLCAITFDNFTVKKGWKEFISRLGIPTEFLHRDEFHKKYGEVKDKLPAVFIKRDSKMKLFISESEINKIESVEKLIGLVNQKVRKLN